MVKLLILLQLAWGLVVSFQPLSQVNLNVLHGLVSFCLAGIVVLLSLKRIHWFVVVPLYFAVGPLLATIASGSDMGLLMEAFPRRLTPLMVALAVMQSRRAFTWLDVQGFQRFFVYCSVVPQLLFLFSILAGNVYMVDYHYGYSRYAGGFSGPHQAAFYFMLNGMAILFWLLYGELSKGKKLVAYANLALLMGFLYMTGTRTAVVGILLFFVYLILRYQGRHRRLKRLALVLLTLLSLRKVASLFVDVPLFISGGSDLVLLGGGRLVIWMHNISVWLSGNWSELVFGLGYGTDRVFHMGERWIGSHNDYLTIAFEAGVLGLLIYLALLLGFMRYFSRHIHASHNSWLQWMLGLGLIALVTNMVSNSFYVRVFPYTFLWMWIAISFMHMRWLRRSEGQARREELLGAPSSAHGQESGSADGAWVTASKALQAGPANPTRQSGTSL